MSRIFGASTITRTNAARITANPVPPPEAPSAFDASLYGAGDGSDVVSWVTALDYDLVSNGASISTVRDQGPGAYFWDTAGATTTFYEPGISHFSAPGAARFEQRTVDKGRFNRLHEGPSSAVMRVRVAEAFDDEIVAFWNTFSLASSQRGASFYVENRSIVVGSGLPQLRLSVGQATPGSLILSDNSGGVDLVPGFWYTLGYSVSADRVAFYVNGEQVREVTGLGLSFTTGDCSVDPAILGGSAGGYLAFDHRHSAIWSSDIGDADHAAIHAVMVAEEGHSGYSQPAIEDIAHHLRANRAGAFSGAAVSTWETLREGGADATQGVSGEQPTYNEDTFGVDGQFGVEFAAGGDHMAWSPVTSSTTWSWCYYGKIPALGAGEKILFDMEDTGNRIRFSPVNAADNGVTFDYDGTSLGTSDGALDDDTEHFVALVSDASTGDALLYVDKTLAATASVTNRALSGGGQIAADSSGVLTDGAGGDLALTYVLDGTALDATQVAQLTDYHRADSGYAP